MARKDLIERFYKLENTLIEKVFKSCSVWILHNKLMIFWNLFLKLIKEGHIISTNQVFLAWLSHDRNMEVCSTEIKKKKKKHESLGVVLHKPSYTTN